MSTILITGGTGMVGTALTDLFINSGHRVIILSRNMKESTHSSIQYAVWNIQGLIDTKILCSVEYIVHLAGENVAEKRWSEKRKAAILNSRIVPGESIVTSLKNTSNHTVKAVIAASAIGWYGPDTNNNLPQGFTEEAPHYNDFLGNTCNAWEKSIEPISELDIRLVRLRIGIVLSYKGGALKEFMKPLSFGLAVSMGSGNQTISWIHIDDLCRMILFAIHNPQLIGTYNAVSPKPVTNKTLVKSLKKVVNKFLCISISLPSYLLKLMLGEMNIEILKSTTVSADKIQKAGFKFHYAEVETALKQIVDKKNSVNTQ